MNGYVAAAVAVLIWASYPVATRAGVTGSFGAQELVVLRFGIGALLFLPYLALHWRSIERRAWLQGIPLTLFQGVGTPEAPAEVAVELDAAALTSLALPPDGVLHLAVTTRALTGGGTETARLVVDAVTHEGRRAP